MVLLHRQGCSRCGGLWSCECVFGELDGCAWVQVGYRVLEVNGVALYSHNSDQLLSCFKVTGDLILVVQHVDEAQWQKRQLAAQVPVKQVSVSVCIRMYVCMHVCTHVVFSQLIKRATSCACSKSRGTAVLQDPGGRCRCPQPLEASTQALVSPSSSTNHSTPWQCLSRATRRQQPRR